MVGHWNTKLYSCTRTFQVRTANLETNLTIKGLASTLPPNLPISTNLFCCNLVGMPRADPIFPSPGTCFLHSGWCTEKSFYHSQVSSSLPSLLLTPVQFLYMKKELQNFFPKEKKVKHIMAFYVISFIFCGFKKLNKAQSFCPKTQTLLGRKYVAK